MSRDWDEYALDQPTLLLRSETHATLLLRSETHASLLSRSETHASRTRLSWCGPVESRLARCSMGPRASRSRFYSEAGEMLRPPRA
ncbi:MAG TPA: hypothetical protein VFS50_14360 [Meiothermus sp.]|nr:hypothetical protein [Meiothermus sp.]